MPKLGMEPIRRKQVMDSVLKCVARDGIDGITLDKTAKLAGISKGVVAYYFKTKDNLLLQSFQSFLKIYLELPKSPQDTIPDPFRAKDFLLEIGKSVLGLLPREGGLSPYEVKQILLQFYSKLSLSQEYREMINKVYNQYLESLTWVLDKGVKQREFRLEDPQKTAIQLLALLDGFLLFSLLEFQGTLEDQFHRYKDFVEGLG